MTALISPCKRYRYRLTREVSPLFGSGRALFVMLNPSTADATTDDPTIRKCCGFAMRHRWAYVDVVNLYAWRATDPRDLCRASECEDIIGPENDTQIGMAADRASVILVAWGALTLGRLSRDAASRARDVLARAQIVGCDVLCLGTAKNGQPRHPLMVAYETPLVPFALQRSA